jgi:hypothetical protein
LQVGSWILAGLLIIVYLATRTAMLTISSKGGESIAVPAKGLGRERVIEFTDAVDSAKLARKARFDVVSAGPSDGALLGATPVSVLGARSGGRAAMICSAAARLSRRTRPMDGVLNNSETSSLLAAW